MTDDRDKLSNWGRWGPTDERGTLNLISAEMIKNAAGLVKTGKTYSLSVPLETEGAQWPARHKLWRCTEFTRRATGRSVAGDVLMMHSHSGTHIDALCHIWYDDQLYNGYDAREHVASARVTRNAISNVPYIVGRGVLLDVARFKGVEHLDVGEAISASTLDACAAAQNVAVQPGDIVLVRTGWIRVMDSDRALFDSGEPGIDVTTLPWLKAHDIVGVGSDNHAVEAMASMPPDDLPVHRVAIRDLGLYLMEYLDLEALARDEVYECLLVIAPLQLTDGAGSPMNPIAIA